MVDYTINVNDVNDKVLGYVANSQQEWIENCVSARLIGAKAEIINILITHCNENNISLATGEDAQINQAFDLGLVELAKDRVPASVPA